MSGSVKVKVCGVTDPDNARLAAEMGADFLGLNFYRASPRYVQVSQALEIASAVREASARVQLVGVFVSSPAAEVAEIESCLKLDLLQFSGDETPEYVAPFGRRAVKAFRIGGAPEKVDLERWRDVWGWLFDASDSSLYGGTGKAWDFSRVSRLEGRVIVAGGIGPDNVRRAIAASRPYAVDVCSRVESAPGMKDPELLRQLFQEVRNAQSQTPS